MRIALRRHIRVLGSDIAEFSYLFSSYIHRKTLLHGNRFEKGKRQVVGILVSKRGKFTRPFLHVGVATLFIVGVVAAPMFTQQSELASAQSPSAILTDVTDTDPLMSTQRSDKVRDKILLYTVEKGDTLSTVAEKFGISTDTVLWQNNLKEGATLTVGQELEILPVSGVSHKVIKGDTVYTLAKKYNTEAQKIVDFPFNDFANPETFTLTPGQLLIIPDGEPEKAKVTTPKKEPQYIAGKNTPSSIATQPGSGGFSWPTQGVITQYPSWYHMAYDIANNAKPPVGASKGGTVTYADCIRGGYGCHVIVDHGDGYQTLYAHLSKINVSKGQGVGQGSVVGTMGNTGRSTGIHLHFEIRKNGVLLNPMNFLKR